MIEIKVIVGLGNPGIEYLKTRHNVGFMILDNFAKDLGVSFDKNKFNGDYADTFINGERLILLKPLSYMNLSGEVVAKFISYFKISLDDVLIVNDDLDLSIAKIRLRKSGSSGGHNGLKNIEFNLGTNCFKRLKIGISNNKSIDTKNYVLGKFSNDQYNMILEILPLTSSILKDFCFGNYNFNYLMNKYN